MVAIQLAGYAAFILASLVLGSRLVLLSRRSRQMPELWLGSSFLLAGVIGYVAWLIIGLLMSQAAPPEAIRGFALWGLAFTVTGASCNAVATAMIFRPGKALARAWVACLVGSAAASWVTYAMSPVEITAVWFWRTLMLVAPVYLWGAVEGISLGGVLRKRARLGLSSPLVADRTRQFGINNLTVLASISISCTGHFAWGNAAPLWISLLSSMSLLVGAGAIWLGFFPPAAYRARLERVSGATADG